MSARGWNSVGEVGRRWLTFAGLLAVALALILVWSGYAYSRTEPTYPRLPKGAVLTEQDTGVRLISLRSVLSLPGRRGDTYQADPGTQFVVATIEVVPTEVPVCGALLLLDGDGRFWRADSMIEPAGLPPCFDLPPGSLTRTVLVYRVPEKLIGGVVGLTVLRGWAEPRPVLLPLE